MKISKVTIKDIANAAGVSAMTVSNVINGKVSKVSSTTIKKVEKAIAELKYVPNFSARSLVSKKSKMIGVIIPQTEDYKQILLENPFYSEIVSGIENQLRKNGYYIMLAGVDKGSNYIDILLNWNLDGAIIMGIYQEDFYGQLKQIKIPVLLIDSYINDDYFYKLGIDDEKGGYIATKYLIDMGHKDIAIITGHIRKDGVAEKRFLGYKRALEEAGILFREDYVYEDSVSYKCGFEAGEKIGRNKNDITAVFATADLIAAGVISAFHSNNIGVPQDISVIGFDNLSISQIIYPSLTTVNQNIFNKGEKSAEIILNILNKNSKEIEKKMLMDINIIERDSVRKIS